jgi:hypothetical protein
VSRSWWAHAAGLALLAVLGECCRACVLVIDPTSALVGQMYQDEMREVETVRGPAAQGG